MDGAASAWPPDAARFASAELSDAAIGDKKREAPRAAPLPTPLPASERAPPTGELLVSSEASSGTRNLKAAERAAEMNATPSPAAGALAAAAAPLAPRLLRGGGSGGSADKVSESTPRTRSRSGALAAKGAACGERELPTD